MDKLKYIIISLALALRIIYAAITIDYSNIDTWEYGAIAHNISENHSFSLFYFDENRLSYKYSSDHQAFVSAYMPPAYVATLLPFYYLTDNSMIRNICLIHLNFIFDFFSIILLFKLLYYKFNRNTALIGIFLFAIAPDFIYASTRIGTSSIFIFLSLLLFYVLSGTSKYRFVYTSLILSIMIYFRSESLILAALLCMYIFLKENKKHAVIILFICAAAVSPWQIRNYLQFNKFIPLTTSSGLNFYRGNNPYYPGFWADENIHSKIMKLDRNNNFEIALNDLYFKEAFNYINENPIDAVLKVPRKLVNLFIFDWKDKRTFNPLFLISHFAFISLFIIFLFKYKSINSQFVNYLFIYITFFALSCSIFFALPRYQTMMKTAIIPIAAIVINIFF